MHPNAHALFLLTGAALLLTASQLAAQWPSPKTSGIPRTSDGKPDLTAKAPLTSDRKPDLSGLWALPDETYWHDISANVGSEGLPFQPWAAALYSQRRDNEGADNPIARCMPAGVPTIDDIPTPFKLIQTPASIAILYEYNMEYRQIFTDGRSLPGDPNPNWLGYSVGSWDGDTLVVKTTGLETQATYVARPLRAPCHRCLARVTERFHRRDFGNMDLEIAVTDLKAYTKPWKIARRLHLMPDNELLEWICVEMLWNTW